MWILPGGGQLISEDIQNDSTSTDEIIYDISDEPDNGDLQPMQEENEESDPDGTGDLTSEMPEDVDDTGIDISSEDDELQEVTDSEGTEEVTGGKAEEELLAGGLTLNANGGTIKLYNYSTSNYEYYTSYTLETSDSNLYDYTPEREGYWFTGWYSEPACTTKLSQDNDEKYLKETPADGTTIYAGWSDEYVTVTYYFGDKAVYTGYMGGSNYKDADSITVSVPKGKRIPYEYKPIDSYIKYKDAHYNLKGWSETNGSSTTIYEYDYKPESDVSLYAVYDTGILVIYHAGDGYYSEYDSSVGRQVKKTEKKELAYINSTQPISVSKYNLPKNDDARKQFGGWYADEGCTTLVTAYTDYSCSTPWDGTISDSMYNIYIKTGTEDINLYAKWVDSTEPVLTLDANAGDAYFCDLETFYVKKTAREFGIKSGEETSFSVYNPKRDDLHYKFTGWYSDKGCTKLVAKAGDYSTHITTTITADSTLYAGWKKAYNVVTFDANGGYYRYYDSNIDEYVDNADKKQFRINESGRVVNPPSAADVSIEDDSKTFEGWYNGSKKIDNIYNATFTADTTLTAKYFECWKVTVDYNGGYYKEYEDGGYVNKTEPYVVRVVKGKALSSGSPYIQEACNDDADKTFGGWFLSSDTEHKNAIDSYYYIPTGDVTIKAFWANNYKVIFDAGEGTFAGGGSRREYKAVENTVYRYNSGASVPENPQTTDANKVFSAWYRGGTRVTRDEIESAVISGNITYNAVYTSAYTVTFNPNGGSFVSKTADGDGCYRVKVAEGESIRGKVPTVKSSDSEHKVFSGWYSDEECTQKVDPYTNTPQTMTLYAGWTECYILTFHTNHENAVFSDGSTTKEVKVIKGTAFRYGEDSNTKDVVFAAPSVTLSGDAMKFPGWYTSSNFTGDRYVFSKNDHYRENSSGVRQYYNGIYGYIPTGDMVFYAKITDEGVNVSFNANGGVFSSYTKSYVDDNGYKWSLSADSKVWTVTVPKGISFGDIGTPQNGFESHPSGMNGYSWAYKEASCKTYMQSNVQVSSDMTVYCKWYSGSSGSSTAPTVTFHAGEGYFYSKTNKTTSYSYTVGNAWGYGPTPDIDDDGRAFAGWYYDEELTRPYPAEYQEFWYSYGNYSHRIKYPAKVYDLYAAYGDVYTVRLDANGGYFDADYDRTKDPAESMRDTTCVSAKVYQGESLMISDYSKRVRRDDDRIFAGWYLDKECTSKAAVYAYDDRGEHYLPKDDVTLYAKWADYEKPDSLRISAGGKAEATIDIGESIRLSANASESLSASEIHWFIEDYNYGSKNTDRDYPAKIDLNGKVTGLAQGTCYIYAEVNGVRSNDLVTINVTNNTVTSSIGIADKDGNAFADTVSLLAGDELLIKGEISPEDSADTLASQVKWTSSNEDVATVTVADGGRNARVSAVSEGTAQITATLGKTKASVNVAVIKGISLDRYTLVLTARDGAACELNVSIPDSVDSSGVTVAAYKAGTEEKAVTVELVKGEAQHQNGVTRVPVTITPTASGLAIEESVDITINASVVINGNTYTDEAGLTLSPMASAGGVTASVEPGSVARGTRVLLANDNGAKVYYTTDGSDPSGASTLYTDAIIIDKTVTIKAIAIKDGRKSGPVATFEYKVDDWGDAAEYKSSLFGDDITKIPESVWYVIDGKLYDKGAATELSVTYTGSSLSFNDKIRMFYGNTRLIENRDYTVSYAKNTAACTATATDLRGKSIAPSFTIKGKGNYAKNETFTFAIAPADIDGAVITSESEVTVAAGARVKLGSTKPVLTFNGKKLSVNKDYVLNYYEGDSVDPGKKIDDAAKKMADTPETVFTIAVSGKDGSNFTGDKNDKVLVRVIDGKDKNTVSAAKLKVGDAKGKAVKLPYYTMADSELAAYYDSDGKLDLEKIFDNSDDDNKPFAYVYISKVTDPLIYGEDYTIEGSDDIKAAGIYSITIKGEAKELSKEERIAKKCSIVGTKMAKLEITGTALSKVKIAGLNTSTEYTGSSITLADLFNPADRVIIAQNAAETSEGNKWSAVTLYTTTTEGTGKNKVTKYHALKEGVDYTLSMANTGVIGKFNLVFTGCGAYTGSVKKTITVKAYNLNDSEKGLAAKTSVTATNAVYSKAGAYPGKVTVKCGETILREGIDYTLSYKNNGKIVTDYNTIKESARPTVIVTGKGNYSGKNQKAFFNIEKADVASAVTLSVNDVTYNEKGKKGYFMVTPKLMDHDKAVKAGKNQDVDAIAAGAYEYYYAEDTTLTDSTEKFAGERMYAQDPVPAGTLIEVRVQVSISDDPKVRTKESCYKATGDGNTAILSGSYRLLAADRDISKATVKFKSGIIYYYRNGIEVIPIKESDLEVSLKVKGVKNPVVLESSDYEIISVKNNILPGTATAYLRGTGEYGGIKKITFKIKAADI